MTSSGATKNYTYDTNGNLINDGVHVYTYDGENRLRTVDWGTANQASYVYDYANRRIKKYTNAAITYYAWEGNQVIAEYDSTGATVYNYVYSGGRLIARMGSGVINWYLNDRLSERLVLDASGNVIGRMAHLPFGEDFGESGTQDKHHFTSYERDSEKESDYGLNRHYSQIVSRFMQIDPQAGVVADPQSLNRYTSARNDPIGYTDPLGLDFFTAPTLPGGWPPPYWGFFSSIWGGFGTDNNGNSAVPDIPVAGIPNPLPEVDSCNGVVTGDQLSKGDNLTFFFDKQNPTKLGESTVDNAYHTGLYFRTEVHFILTGKYKGTAAEWSFYQEQESYTVDVLKLENGDIVSNKISYLPPGSPDGMDIPGIGVPSTFLQRSGSDIFHLDGPGSGLDKLSDGSTIIERKRWLNLTTYIERGIGAKRVHCEVKWHIYFEFKDGEAHITFGQGHIPIPNH